MLIDLMDVLTSPEDYAYTWRNGELYIEPVEATCILAPSRTHSGDAHATVVAIDAGNRYGKGRSLTPHSHAGARS